jgi:hypothetical protein
MMFFDFLFQSSAATHVEKRGSHFTGIKAIVDSALDAWGSPGINAGRGLKPYYRTPPRLAHRSPGINAGRGLKLALNRITPLRVMGRPVLMPGVD